VIFVMTKSFYGEEDPSLTDKLLEEAPGILNWALEGLDRLNQRGYLLQPTAGAEALQQLDDIASPVSAFLRDRCEIKPDATVGVDDLWKAWKEWCEDQNLPLRTKSVFGRDLMARAPTVHKVRPRDEAGKRVHEYVGIGIVTNTMRDWYDRRDHHDQAEPKLADLGAAGHPGHSGHSNSAMKSQLDNGQTDIRDAFGPFATCTDCDSATYYYDINGSPKCSRHKDAAKQGQAS
jgi:phage/plasmid-associated DNA primase